MQKETAIKDVFIAEFERLESEREDVTLWDVTLSLFSKHAEIYLLVLKADINIIEKLAQGLSVYSISNTLSVPSKHVMEAASVWGLRLVEQTVDFNPLLIYREGMSPEEMLLHMNDILAIPIDLDIADTLVYNIERFHTLDDFLKEEE